MARNKEGGVRTKKVIVTVMAVLAIVLAAGAVVLTDSHDVDGANSVIKGDTNLVKVKGTLTYEIIFYETDEYSTLDISYDAVLKDSNGTTQSNAVSPSSGYLTNGVATTLTVTAPSAAGKYTLVVTFKEKIDGGDAITSEKSVVITVVNPIKLSSTMVNNSNVDFTDFAVYFYVDGDLIDGSKTLISVKSGESTTVSYDWVTESISNGEHSFKIVAGSENIGDYGDEVILGGEGTFYVGHSDYGLMNILLAILFIILVIAVIYLWRKPVKNYGKPKSRRR